LLFFFLLLHRCGNHRCHGECNLVTNWLELLDCPLREKWTPMDRSRRPLLALGSNKKEGDRSSGAEKRGLLPLSLFVCCH
jgi:hypothetical protein